MYIPARTTLRKSRWVGGQVGRRPGRVTRVYDQTVRNKVCPAYARRADVKGPSSQRLDACVKHPMAPAPSQRTWVSVPPLGTMTASTKMWPVLWGPLGASLALLGASSWYPLLRCAATASGPEVLLTAGSWSWFRPSFLPRCALGTRVSTLGHAESPSHHKWRCLSLIQPPEFFSLWFLTYLLGGASNTLLNWGLPYGVSDGLPITLKSLKNK